MPAGDSRWEASGRAPFSPDRRGTPAGLQLGQTPAQASQPQHPSLHRGGRDRRMAGNLPPLRDGVRCWEKRWGLRSRGRGQRTQFRAAPKAPGLPGEETGPLGHSPALKNKGLSRVPPRPPAAPQPFLQHLLAWKPRPEHAALVRQGLPTVSAVLPLSQNATPPHPRPMPKAPTPEPSGTFADIRGR